MFWKDYRLIFLYFPYISDISLPYTFLVVYNLVYDSKYYGFTRIYFITRISYFVMIRPPWKVIIGLLFMLFSYLANVTYSNPHEFWGWVSSRISEHIVRYGLLHLYSNHAICLSSWWICSYGTTLEIFSSMTVNETLVICCSKFLSHSQSSCSKRSMPASRIFQSRKVFRRPSLKSQNTIAIGYLVRKTWQLTFNMERDNLWNRAI